MKQQSNLKLFTNYVLLNVLGMIGLSCYILADTFFVSKGLGANGLTALNLAIPVYSFIHGSGLMLGVGGATKYSIFKGQQADKETDKVFTHTFYGAVVLSAFFVLAGMFLSESLTILLGADETVFDMTNIYLKVIMLFAPAFIMNDVLICFVRNDGNPRLSMVAMLLGSFSNIVLDYIFIFPLGMGIFGAVLATGIAPVISMMILSRHLVRRAGFRLKWQQLQPRLLAGILALGVPSLIGEVASGVVMIVFNMIIMQLIGNVGVAAYGVVANLSLVVVSIYTGIAQGMQPLTSRAYGVGDRKTVAQILGYAIKTLLAVSAIVYLVMYVFADPITTVFNSENNMRMQEIAVEGLRLYFTAIPFVGFNVVISMYFTSIEKAVPAQMISLLRGFFLIIPLAFILANLCEITGVWLAFPLTEGIVSILGILFWKKYRKLSGV